MLDAEPLLEGGEVERWADRPVTKFERRGVAEGRPIADFRYRRPLVVNPAGSNRHSCWVEPSLALG